MVARVCEDERAFGVRVFGVRVFVVRVFVVQTFANSGLQNAYKSDSNSRAKVCQMGVYSLVERR